MVATAAAFVRLELVMAFLPHVPRSAFSSRWIDGGDQSSLVAGFLVVLALLTIMFTTGEYRASAPTDTGLTAPSGSTLP